MNEQAFHQLDLSRLPANDTMLTLGDNLMVIDNLETDTMVSHHHEIDSLVSHFPVKLSSTCLIIVNDGTVRFNVNFRDFVVSKGTCAIISSGTIIQHAEYDEQARVILLSFSWQNMPSLPTSRHRNAHRFYALQAVLIHLLPSHLEMLMTCYKMLRTILSDTSFATNREDAASSCIELMASIIAQGADNQPEISSKATRRDEIVARFLECVNENYRQHRELSFYANELHLSLKYMSHVVHEQTGRHPSAWIRDYVILDAKAMLRSGRYTVQQVAAELNFPNQSFFGKYFKEAVGVSPKKWR